MKRLGIFSRGRQTGFTLIELMVSLVIGFAVVGALVAAYMTSLRGSTSNDALVQVSEDATLALNVIRSQVAQAGFSTAVDVGPGAGGLTTMRVHDFTPHVLGCSNSNFGANLNVVITATPGCAGASTSDAIEVAYEGSQGVGSNAILGGVGGDKPLDCLGNGYLTTHDTVLGGDYYLNDSKFYVENGSLYCHGPGNAAGAPLVEHVDFLRISYGSAEPGLTPPSKQVTYYQPASAAVDWDSVIAVSICIQVRSAQKVLDTVAQATLGAYIDCDNQPGTLADGYLHRSFTTTVVLQNKL